MSVIVPSSCEAGPLSLEAGVTNKVPGSVLGSVGVSAGGRVAIWTWSALVSSRPGPP